MQAADTVEFALHLRQQFHLRALAFVPGFEQKTADARLHAVEAVDLERRVVLRKRLEDRTEFIGVSVQVIQVGRLRRRRHHEDDALVFIRCQLRAGEHQQYRDQAQHQHGKHQHHRTGIEGAVQNMLIADLEALEEHVQAMRQARRVFFMAQQQRAHHRRQGQGHHA
ncbi:hypothetical protein D3C80_1409060 [compost metagenome]